MLVSDADYQVIIKRLIAKTEDGTLDWRAWQGNVGEFSSESQRFVYYIGIKTDDTYEFGRTDAEINAQEDTYRFEIWQDDPAGENKRVMVGEVVQTPESVLGAYLQTLYGKAKQAAYASSTLKDDVLADLE